MLWTVTASSPPDVPGRESGFDLLRIVAASLVIVSHAFPLSGRFEPRVFGYEALTYGTLGVAIFFAVSGYLVHQSWHRDANVKRFLTRRAARLFPALTVALLITVFALGPLVSSQSASDYLADSQTYRYLVGNLSLFLVEYDLPGVWLDQPTAAVNGPIWTLRLEFTAYVLLMALGVAGLLRHRAVLPIGFIAAVAGSAVLPERFIATFPLYSTARLFAFFAAEHLLQKCLTDRVCSRRSTPGPRWQSSWWVHCCRAVR